MTIGKAAVTAPPVRDFYFTPGRATALGAESVRRQLENNGVETVLFNFPRMNGRGSTLPLPDRYAYLKPYLVPGERGPLTFFPGRKLFGPDFGKAAELILAEEPDILFISLFAWTYGEDALELAREVKKRRQKAFPIVLGGAGAAVFPEYYRVSGLIDAVLTGEAERDIPDLLKWIEKGGDISLCESSGLLTEEPAPAISFHGDRRGKQWLTLSLSRGCPKQCRFCSNFLTQGRRFRTVDLKVLEKVLLRLPIDRNRNVHINLEDDNLLIRKKFFNEFLELSSRLFPLRTLSADNGLDYTLLDLDYTDFLIKSGFTDFSLSLGSAEPEILAAEKRPANLSRLESVLERLEKRGISSTTFFIAGLPGDSRESVVDTLLYIHGLPTRSGISPFYPVPGLPRFDDKSVFRETHPSLCSGSSAYPWGKSLTTGELVTAFRLSRFSNLLKKTERDIKENELIEAIRSTGKLHTLIGKNRTVTPLENMDGYLCRRFLDKVIH